MTLYRGIKALVSQTYIALLTAVFMYLEPHLS